MSRLERLSAFLFAYTIGMSMGASLGDGVWTRGAIAALALGNLGVLIVDLRRRYPRRPNTCACGAGCADGVCTAQELGE